MKKILLTAVIIFAAIFFSTESKAEFRYGGYGYFYSSLAPHGSWIELNDGLVVWKPAYINRGWAPYTVGQWIWTSDGWYWDSYEDFGYITYHYGRWYFDDYYGWIWVPDNQWAPAWVEWRYDDDYIGWAPLPPYAIFSVNIGIHFTYDYHAPYHHWNFVRYRHFCDPYVSNHYVGGKYRHKIYSKTRYRNEYAYERDRVVNRGVDVDFVRKRSGQTIRERDIERVNDVREVRNRNSRNSNERVRTYVVSQEQLKKNDDNVVIKRSDRKSSLESSKIEIGTRRNTERGSSTQRIREDNKENNEQIRTNDRVIRDDNNRNKEQVRTRDRVIKEENKVKDNVITAPPLRKANQQDRVIEKRDNTMPVTETKTAPKKVGSPERRVERTELKRVERTEETIRQTPERRVERTEPIKKTETRERKVESQPKQNTEPVRVEGRIQEMREKRKQKAMEIQDDKDSLRS